VVTGNADFARELRDRDEHRDRARSRNPTIEEMAEQLAPTKKKKKKEYF